MNLNIATPRWAIPLLQPSRYKGAYGGRSGGKSHFFAERLVEHHIANPDLCSVCIREIQKSLKYSAKKLIEDKIKKLGVSHLFRITTTEIKRLGGEGVILFQGMQDHTADSIKSLEGFDIAWVEEAQRLSAHSLKLLRPTIRKEGSELWFTWNPDQQADPVDNLLRTLKPADSIVVPVNYTDNPFCTTVTIADAKEDAANDPDYYAHVWLGGYNTKSDDQVLAGKWVIAEFDDLPGADGPYYGGDWGFSTDPTTLIKSKIKDNILYICEEVYGHGIETDDLPGFYDRMEGAKTHVVRADNARPENISYMKRHGYPRVTACDKWPGSVEDGISKLRSFKRIVIHPDCKHTANEALLWKYKMDKADNVLPDLIDKNNHCWDAIRYSLGPLVKRPTQIMAFN